MSTCCNGTAIVIGVFDGMHKGHQHLLEHLKQVSQSRGLVPLVITFQRHPSCVLGRREDEMWLDEETERIAAIQALGIEVDVMPFTQELASLSACEFVKQYLIDKKCMKVLLLGYDSRFGNRAKDDFDQLESFGITHGYEVLHDTPLLLNNDVVSSSRIRNLLKQGAVDEVTPLLDRLYNVKGVVLHGRHDGRKIGFPTANVDLSESRKLMPLEGVYEVRVVFQNQTWKGMANWGGQPTYGEQRKVLEVHLLGFEGDLYGQSVEVCFVRRMRDIMKFDSIESLVSQLQKDKELLK